MVSSYFRKFIEELISNKKASKECLDYVRNAFTLSTHLVRVRSVARSAGFCAYYGRMAEKMGVAEVLESPSIIKGREIHRVLSLASLNLFMENSTTRQEQAEALATKYVEEAIEELREFFNINNLNKSIAIRLLTRLIRVLPKARDLLKIKQSAPLFPIVEQTLIDYGTRMYGAPDLILESKSSGDERKAIVVEWKTYSFESKRNYPSDFEKAQVIAYSIIEAKRLGYTRLREILESILGIRYETLKKIIKNEDRFDQEEVRKIMGEIKQAKLLKVLPVIVTPSGSYPPHPLMYVDQKTLKGDYKTIFRRFKKLYILFRGVIVASEHLAIQIMNIPELLRATSSNDVKCEEIKRYCITKDGYYAFNYTPFRYLRCGKPGNWDKYPCRICQFRGEKGPCSFYFLTDREKDYFDKLMWWARYVIYWRRERDLVNHRAMYELFNHTDVRSIIFSSNNPCEFEVDLSKIRKMRIKIEKGDRIIYVVRVRRGNQDLGKFRFVHFKISDVEYDEENNVIELRRELRDREKKIGVIGFLRKSIHLSIIEPAIDANPLMSINTFVMIEDSFLDDNNKVVYRCYSPSPVLFNNFMIFGKYIVDLKKRAQDARVLAYETPVDLTIMELRSVDALHRYLKILASNNPEKISKLTKKINGNIKRYNMEELEDKELIEEASIIKEHVTKPTHTFAVINSLYDLLRNKIVGDCVDR